MRACTWSIFTSHLVYLGSSIYQVVYINIKGQKFCGMCRIPNVFKIRLFPNGKPISSQFLDKFLNLE